MDGDRDPTTLATRIAADIHALPKPDTSSIRRLRRHYSRQLAACPGRLVLDTARLLHREPGCEWVAYELILEHEGALALVGEDDLVAFGQGIDSWGAVDCFAGLLAGPAWLRGQVRDELIHSWARSPDRWWRRAALVCTVVLNTPSHGGAGDLPRTLAVCRMLVADHDDMVVKALSWALRRLVGHDAGAVRRFLAEHDSVLAARVKREVRNKLDTGLKNPRKKRQS